MLVEIRSVRLWLSILTYPDKTEGKNLKKQNYNAEQLSTLVEGHRVQRFRHSTVTQNGTHSTNALAYELIKMEFLA